MNPEPQRPKQIELSVAASHPELLRGLELWLNLGLLSDVQVRRMGQRYLTCPLPAVVPPVPDSEPRFITETEVQRSRPSRRSTDRPQRSPMPPATVPTGFVSDRLQALMAEISVIWLLVLGVFMVVLSSGVLAASQWQNFSPAGQYLVLFSYTIAFWLVGWGASQRPHLRLTATMLQVTTLLIIPINFWMMDAVLLAQGGWGWAIALVAALSLTLISIRLSGSQSTPPCSPWLRVGTVALSWLHWGWSLPGMALIASYVGTIGTTAVLVYDGERSPAPSDPSSQPAEGDAARSGGSAQAMLVMVIATAVLILRATWVAGVPWSQLGLAIGLCGWLLCWFACRTPVQPLLNRVGGVLLVLGWAVSSSATPPIQAIAVSGLALERLNAALGRSPRRSTLTLGVLVGLQAYGLLWRLIPPSGREVVLNGFEAIAGQAGMPMALVGLGLLPYLWLLLGLARHWRRATQPGLADYLDILALLLGALLLLVSAPNPWVRSLQFTLSALTLGGALRLRSTLPTGLIYLTHLLGLAAIVSWTDWLAPHLSPSHWALGFVGLTLAEWGLAALRWPASESDRLPRWQESAWVVGLGLSGLSYLLWAVEVPLGDRPWLWLLIPVGLTLLAYRPAFPHAQTAANLSTLALVLAQWLTVFDPISRLVGLGLATLLMLWNTRRCPSVGMACLTLGFGLAAVADGVWYYAGDDLPESALGWIPAIAILLLWGLWQRWIDRPPSLRRDYAIAANLWASGLCGLTLVLLSLVIALVYLAQTPLETGWWVAIALINGGLVYRLWRDAHELGRYGLAWGVELLVAGGLLHAAVREPTPWAIAHLALGAAAFLLGEQWVRGRSRAYPTSLHLVPLGYATLGLLLGHTDFVATTGLYTLALGLLLAGVGRRTPWLKPLAYLAVLATTAGAYELLVYQLLQAEGGDAGDGMVLLGGLAMLMALVQRLLSRWIAPFLRLSRLEWDGIIALHWMGGAGWLLLALVYPMSVTGQWLWIGVALGLAVNALAAGRRLELWTDLGIGMALLAIAKTLYLLVPDSQWLTIWAAAIACPAAIALYWLPWTRWGWPPQPGVRWAHGLPGLTLAATAWGVTIPVLLIVAAYYTWLARQERQIRLSYLSVLLADWAIVRWLQDGQVNDSIWYTLVVGLSLIYVAQVDPQLRGPDERETRHWLRCLAIGLISLNAIYESEQSLAIAAITLIYSIGLVLLGLSWRIRAVLFVGTLTFIVQVIRQLWLLVALYPLLIWAVGLVIGLLFIWIAATFEARRHQVIAFVRYWMAELEEWQ